MRCSTIAVFGLAAIARATWDGQFSYPPGIEPLALAAGNSDFNIKTFGPTTGPPSDCISVWHPPHPDVYIDDCDSNKEHGWHWVHPGKPKWPDHDKPGKDKTKTKDKGHEKTKTKEKGHEKTKTKDHDKPDKTKQPEQPAPTSTPQWKWTTSTVTQTAVSTIFSCPPSVPNCPGDGSGGGTKYQTVTVPAIVTICPVPVEPNPVPTTAPAANPPPPVTTQPPATQPAAPSNPAPPNTLTSIAVPPPVKSSSAPPVAPPATTTRPTDVGTVTRPNPTATTSRAVVTAGANPNVQCAGGLVVAVAAAAAIFI